MSLVRDETTKLGALAREWRYAPTDREIGFWDQIDIDTLRKMTKEDRAKFKPAQRPWLKPEPLPILTPKQRSKLKTIANRMLRRT